MGPLIIMLKIESEYDEERLDNSALLSTHSYL